MCIAVANVELESADKGFWQSHMTSYIAQIRRQERTFATHVASAVREYATAANLALPEFETPDNGGQGIWSANRRPFDLVIRFTRFRMMMLEAKLILHGNGLVQAFDFAQHIFLTLLQKEGVPVNYLYPGTGRINGAPFTQILHNSFVASPEAFCCADEKSAILTPNERHFAFAKIIHELFSGGEPNGEKLLMFFEPELCEELVGLTTGMAIVMADIEARQIFVLNPEKLQRTIRAISAAIKAERPEMNSSTRKDREEISRRLKFALDNARTILHLHRTKVVAERLTKMLESREVDPPEVDPPAIGM